MTEQGDNALLLPSPVLTEGMRKMGKESLTCLICHKVFTMDCRYAAHVRLHCGPKDFECKVCGKRFALAYRLLLHSRVHTGDRPFICKYCGKGFARGHNLKQHERVHSGIKPYECPICGKCYTQTKTLKEHARTHSGEKPFQCHICEKLFRRYDNLKVHQLTHADNKRHVCAHCGKKYADLRCFQKHVRSHSGGADSLWYGCTACSQQFATYRELRLHTRSHDVPPAIRFPGGDDVRDATATTTCVKDDHTPDDQFATSLDSVCYWPQKIIPDSGANDAMQETCTSDESSVIICGACGRIYTIQRQDEAQIIYRKNCLCPITEDDLNLLASVTETNRTIVIATDCEEEKYRGAEDGGVADGVNYLDKLDPVQEYVESSTVS